MTKKRHDVEKKASGRVNAGLWRFGIGWRKILPALLPVVVVSAFALCRGKSTVHVLRECRVCRKAVESVIRERGFLESRETVPVDVEARGEIVEIIENGKKVKAGDVILRTDTSAIEEDLENMELNILSVKAEKEVHGANYDFIRFKSANDLKLLKEEFAYAELAYKTAQAGLTDKERRLLEIDEQMAALDLSDAEEEYDRQKRLFEKGFVSSAMLEPFERRVKSAKERVSELRTRTELEARGESREKLVEMKKECERLKALLERSSAATERRLESVSRSVDVDDARLRDQQHEIDLKKRDLELSVTRAPTNGIVSLKLYRDWRAGGVWKEYRPGVTVRHKDHVADIVNPGAMNVEIMIHESDIDRVKAGMKCRVSIPACPGRTFSGRISNIGGIGSDRSDIAPRGYDHGPTGVVVFNATVSLHEDKVGEFRPGMSAIVDIIAKSPQEKLVIPRAAVNRVDGEWTVRRKGDAGSEIIRVEGRIFNDEYFVVEKGLREGEVLLIGGYGYERE